MKKYLISYHGYIESLILSNDYKYFLVTNDEESILKVIKFYAEDSLLTIKEDSLKIFNNKVTILVAYVYDEEDFEEKTFYLHEVVEL